MSGGRHEFGDWTLDLDRSVLLRAGAEVPLRPKSFDVLRYLVEHRGKLVTREELLQAVWGSVIVTDGSVTKCLIDVRRALGDNNQDVVRTIPRRGYLFDPEPSTPNPPVPPPRARSWLVAGAAVALFAVAAVLLSRQPPGAGSEPIARVVPSIAVLPFVNLSQDGSQQYVADGLSEELIHLLTQELSVPVIARGSSFTFRGGETSAQEVARRLGVTHVLEGSVRRSNGQVSVTAQLIDGASGRRLWSQTYDRNWTDVLGLQRDIARTVAVKLRISLAELSTPGTAVSSAALDAFLLGQFYYNRREPGDVKLAAAAFQKAIALEPNYARAWAALSGTYRLLGDSGVMPRAEARQGQIQAAQRAISIDPKLTEARLRYSDALLELGERSRSYAEFLAAERSDPGHVLVLGARAGHLMFVGRIDDAVDMQTKALRLDPVSIVARSNLAVYLYSAGQYGAALEQLRTIRRLASSGESSTLVTQGLNVLYLRILVAQSRFREAGEVVEGWPAGPDRDYGRALLWIVQGSKAAADPWLKRLAAAVDLAANDSMSLSASSLAFSLAELYAARGELDRAFRWLERASSLMGEEWQPVAGEMRYSPFASEMRKDPRWAEWVARQPELQP